MGTLYILLFYGHSEHECRLLFASSEHLNTATGIIGDIYIHAKKIGHLNL